MSEELQMIKVKEWEKLICSRIASIRRIVGRIGVYSGIYKTIHKFVWLDNLLLLYQISLYKTVVIIRIESDFLYNDKMGKICCLCHECEGYPINLFRNRSLFFQIYQFYYHNRMPISRKATILINWLFLPSFPLYFCRSISSPQCTPISSQSTL